MAWWMDIFLTIVLTYLFKAERPKGVKKGGFKEMTRVVVNVMHYLYAFILKKQ